MLLQKWERIFLTTFLFKLETRLFCDSTSTKCTHIYSFPSHVQARMMLCFWTLSEWVSPKDFLIRFLALGHITHINMSDCISSRKRKRKRPCAVVIICLYMVVSRPDANNIEPVLLTRKQQKCHVTFSTYTWTVKSDFGQDSTRTFNWTTGKKGIAQVLMLSIAAPGLVTSCITPPHSSSNHLDTPNLTGAASELDRVVRWGTLTERI